jgi:hypothetical protein
MILDPATYTCPSHHTDLTHQVLEQLDDDYGWSVAYKPRKIRRSQPEFEVVVSCPGEGKAHQLTCRGTLQP